MTPEIAARLESLGIQMATQTREYSMFVRGNCVALAQSAEDRFLSIGSSGMMTEKGLAYLVWLDGAPLLSSHGVQVAAEAEQVQAIQQFSGDLKTALGLTKE